MSLRSRSRNIGERRVEAQARTNQRMFHDSRR
jgi:hypothetical protein